MVYDIILRFDGDKINDQKKFESWKHIAPYIAYKIIEMID